PFPGAGRVGCATCHDSGPTAEAGLVRGGHPSPAGRRRWQRLGYAIVCHNGPLSRHQVWTVGRLHGGPQALLTAFTAAEACGLTRWERNVVHLLVPAGTRLRSRA